MEQQLDYISSSFLLNEVKIDECNVAGSLERVILFNDLYKKLYLPVLYFAKTFVSTQEAEDITSDSFLKLWRSNIDFTIIPRVKTWLNVCTKNACLDLLADKKKEVTKNKIFAYSSAKDEISPYESDIQEALLEKIASEIEKLPPKCKKVFKMSYLERLTSREIAVKLGISENTVSNHRIKGLKVIRLALKGYTYLHLVTLFIPAGFLEHHW